MAIDFKKLVKGLFIKDSSDPSKGLKLEIDPTAATNTTTTILAEQQANVLLSLPGEDSELVGDIANQTLENKTIDAANNTIVGITNAEISVTAGIDATKIGDGSVDNTEFQYLNGVSSNIQTQLTINANDINGHITNPSGAHAASAISNTPSGNLSATDLQAAVNELQSDIDTRALASNLTAHITDTTDAHLSSAIGYSGNANSTVEGALDNLYTYKLTVGSSQQLVSDLNANSNKITALATPVSGTDAANKNYVDGIAAGLDPKESVRVATTASVGGSYATTPSNGRFTGAATTIDGVTLATNDRVLIKDQADAKQNGIYVYDGAGQYTRSADMDGSPSSEVSGGNFVFVAQGTTNGASGFVLVASGIVTLNTDNLNFTQFSGGANSANKTLSNLDAPTSINQDLIPDAANSRNLGSTTNNFFDGYVTRLKDPSNVVSFHTENRQLLDSSGVSSVTFSSPTEVSFNNKKLNLIGSAAGLAYATNKQNVQDYLKNFIADGDAEGANIISVYNDSSTTRPVDGTGGTQANLTPTITSTNPLSGTNSFLLTKSGSASTQGSGFSIPFTVPIGQQAKVLQIDIDYIVNSGTFVAGSSSAESDMIVYLYDVTNSTLIEPSSIKFLSNSSTISDKFTANFQTSATGTSYRLILHCQSASTANYALKCEFSVKPCQYVYGTPISDWVSYTPTLSGGFSNGNSNASVTGKWRRVGDSIELDGKITVGSSNTFSSSHLQISLPSGLSWDTSKIAFEDNVSPIGFAQIYDSSFGGGYKAFPVKFGTTTFAINTPFNNSFSGTTFERLDFNGLATGTTYPFAWANGDIINFKVEAMPITGWSSSTQVSDGYDGRLIASRMNRITTGQSISGSSDVKVQFNAKDYDKTNSLDVTTNYRFTAPSYGFYRISGMLAFSAGTADEVYALLYKNGSSHSTLGWTVVNTSFVTTIQFNSTIELNANDYVEIYVNPTGTSQTILSSASIFGGTYVQFEKLQAPQTMSATERVSARYVTGSGQSIANTATVIVNFDTLSKDTHGLVTTGASWKFTAQEAGTYSVSALVRYANSQSWSSGSYITLHLYKNGSAYSLRDYLFQAAVTPAQGPSVDLNDDIDLVAGDYIDIRASHGESTARTLVAASVFNRITIKKVK